MAQINKTLMTIAIAAFCGSAAVTGLALTAARPAAQPEAGVAADHPLAHVMNIDPAKSEAAWMAASMPGTAHAWLGQFIGTWSTKTSMDMGNGPMVSEGTAEFSWLVEGRFLLQEFNGDMMGMPLQGYGVQGFDNLKRQYVGTWLDSMSTGITMTQGSLDQTGKIMTLVGGMDEPTTGEMNKPVAFVTTVIDDDHMRFEAKELIHGEPFTVFTIDYQRID